MNHSNNMEDPPPYPLASVDNALRLLQMLRDEGRLRVSECAQELGVARSTAHRLLAMLVYRNFAVQDGTHAYLPGPAMSTTQITSGLTVRQLRQRLLPSMDVLCDDVGETIHLMVRVGTRARIIASVESTQALHIGDRQGAILPAHLVSGGKAMLAALNGNELAKLYRPNRPEQIQNWTASSETTHPEDDRPAMTAVEFQCLLDELDRVRRMGYAVNVELTEPGICAVGMCLRESGHPYPLAALSISVPTPRFSQERIAPLVDALRSAVRQAELGPN